MQSVKKPGSVIDWDDIPIEKQSGETGFAWTRTYETGTIRIVIVEYSPDFMASG